MMFIPLVDGASHPRLVFEYGFDEREAFEARLRGFRSHVIVEFEGGDSYPLFFYDPTALRQEVERGVEWGIPCVAEPGMVVVPEITEHHMRTAVARLVQEGYFEFFKPRPATSS